VAQRFIAAFPDLKVIMDDIVLMVIRRFIAGDSYERRSRRDREMRSRLRLRSSHRGSPAASRIKAANATAPALAVSKLYRTFSTRAFVSLEGGRT
jgi:hypothetical protein